MVSGAATTAVDDESAKCYHDLNPRFEKFYANTEKSDNYPHSPQQSASIKPAWLK